MRNYWLDRDQEEIYEEWFRNAEAIAQGQKAWEEYVDSKEADPPSEVCNVAV